MAVPEGEIKRPSHILIHIMLRYAQAQLDCGTGQSTSDARRLVCPADYIEADSLIVALGREREMRRCRTVPSIRHETRVPGNTCASPTCRFRGALVFVVWQSASLATGHRDTAALSRPGRARTLDVPCAGDVGRGLPKPANDIWPAPSMFRCVVICVGTRVDCA
jgi:hypothetical protein